MQRSNRVGARGSGPQKDPPTKADIALSRQLNGKLSPWTLQDYRRQRWLPTVPVAPLPGAGARRPVVYADAALAVASIINRELHATHGRRVTRSTAVFAAASMTCAVPLEGVSNAYKEEWQGAERRLGVGPDRGSDEDQAKSAAGAVVTAATETRMGRRVRRNLAYDVVQGDVLLGDALEGVFRPIFFGLTSDGRPLRTLLTALNIPEEMIDVDWLHRVLLDLGRGLSPDHVRQMLSQTRMDDFGRAVVLARRGIRVFNYYVKKNVQRRNVLTHDQVFDAALVTRIAIVLLALVGIGVGTMDRFEELINSREPNRRLQQWSALAARLERTQVLTL